MKKFFSLLLIISFFFVGNVYGATTATTGTAFSATNAVVDWALGEITADTSATRIATYTNLSAAGADKIIGTFASTAGNGQNLSIVVSSTGTFEMRHSQYATLTNKANAALAYTVDILDVGSKFESRHATACDGIGDATPCTFSLATGSHDAGALNLKVQIDSDGDGNLISGVYSDVITLTLSST